VATNIFRLSVPKLHHITLLATIILRVFLDFEQKILRTRELNEQNVVGDLTAGQLLKYFADIYGTQKYPFQKYPDFFKIQFDIISLSKLRFPCMYLLQNVACQRLAPNVKLFGVL
jgi:hypothetical protein